MNLKLPVGDFRAYLFDCDGTIADSMPLHYKAWTKALAEYGATYEEDLFYAWGGKPVRKIIADLNEMQGLNMPVDVLAARKESFYHAQLHELQGIPDVIEHIEAQHGRIPFAVVSGSRRATVVGSLTALNLLDGFLLAASKLNVAPEYCLVFEDTDLGIQAASAAGMQSVLVAQPVREKSGTGAKAKT